MRELLLAAFIALTAASHVVELGDDSFDEQLSKNAETLWLVKFYAPWCGHCKKMAPVLEAFADEIASSELASKVRVAKVDCTANMALRDRLKIKGYPTTLLFRDGNQWEMQAQRSKEGLRQTVEMLLQPPVLDLTPDRAGKDALESLLRLEGSVVFALIKNHDNPSSQGAELLSSYHRIAVNKQLVAKFVATDSPKTFPDIAEKITPDMPLPLIMKLTRGETPIVYSPSAGETDVDAALLNWVEHERFPIFGVVDRHNFHGLLSTDGLLALAIVDPDPKCPTVHKASDMELECSAHVSVEDEIGTKHLGALLRDIAISNAASGGKELGETPFRFGLLDGRKWGAYLSEIHGVERAQLPVLLLLRGGSPRGFHVELYGPYPGSRVNDEASLRELLRDAGSGVLRLQYTGVWGLPERVWKRVKASVPMVPFEKLESLPRYTFSVGFGLIFILLLLKFILLAPPIEEPHTSKMEKSD